MSNFGQLGSQMLRGAAAGMKIGQNSEEWKAGQFDRDLNKASQDLALSEAGSMQALAKQASNAAKQEQALKLKERQVDMKLKQARATKLSADAFKSANKRAATAGTTGNSTVMLSNRNSYTR